MKKFSFNTIKNFDEHILQSIPNYDLLFDSILKISEYFKDESKRIYDLGCSTGKLLKALEFKGEKIGIDNCDNLLPIDNTIKFIKYNLNEPYKFDNACIIYSIFTLQFLRKEIRQRLINDIYKGLCLGGVFIIAEKTYTKDSMLQDIFTFSYYDYKKCSFTAEEILEKEKSLRLILHPQKSEENITMLKNAGFKTIEMFYKYFQFEGYICIK